MVGMLEAEMQAVLDTQLQDTFKKGQNHWDHAERDYFKVECGQ